jgi:hypothetical protein
MKSPVRSNRTPRPKRKSAGRRKVAKASKVKSRLKPAPQPKRGGKAIDPLDAFIAGAARALGLTIERAWMPAVRANLRVTLVQAALVDEFMLPDESEPAPVFRA